METTKVTVLPYPEAPEPPKPPEPPVPPEAPEPPAEPPEQGLPIVYNPPTCDLSDLMKVLCATFVLGMGTAFAVTWALRKKSISGE